MGNGDRAIDRILEGIEVDHWAEDAGDSAGWRDELAAAESAEYGLAERLYASPGTSIDVHLYGAHQVSGVLRESNDEAIVVDEGDTQCIIRISGIVSIRGLPTRHCPKSQWDQTDIRRSLGSVLRPFAGSVGSVRMDGKLYHGTLMRVWRDYAEWMATDYSRRIQVISLEAPDLWRFRAR